jgi:two-component system response regulator MprA
MEKKRALVLVVDNDVRAAGVLVRLLRQDGFEVAVAPDGPAAMQRFSHEPMPDILVTDLQMPYVDGLAVAKYGQLCRPGLAVFIVTGYPHLAAQKTATLHPVPRVFTKPLDYAALSQELDGSVSCPPAAR